MDGETDSRRIESQVHGVGWREEYEMLPGKYGLEEDEEEESGSAAAWKRKIEKQNWENWQEVDRKSSMKWYH